MRKGYLLLLTLPVLLCIAVMQGCKKTNDKKAVTIVNRLDKDVTFDLYSSKEDYASGADLLMRTVIPAGDNKVFPGNNFEEGATYYMDWYTEDYYYNNWFNDNFPVTGNRVKIAPREGDNTYYLEPAYHGQGRNAFLQGAGTQTSWIAVGAYLYSDATGYTNQWNNIKADERFRRVIVRKNFIAEYTYKLQSGETVTDNIEFMVHQAEVPYIEFRPANGGTGNMVGGKLPTAAPPDYKSNAIDTVMALFPDNEYYFMMVRQQ